MSYINHHHHHHHIHHHHHHHHHHRRRRRRHHHHRHRHRITYTLYIKFNLTCSHRSQVSIDTLLRQLPKTLHFMSNTNISIINRFEYNLIRSVKPNI